MAPDFGCTYSPIWPELVRRFVKFFGAFDKSVFAFLTMWLFLCGQGLFSCNDIFLFLWL
jgi:ABC-type phosphate/phosphonate transport system permease subunit